MSYQNDSDSQEADEGMTWLILGLIGLLLISPIIIKYALEAATWINTL